MKARLLCMKKALIVLMFFASTVNAEPIRVNENLYGFEHVCIKTDKNADKYSACFMNEKWALIGKAGDTVWHFYSNGNLRWLQFNNVKNRTSVIHKYTPNCENGTLDITQTITYSKPRLEGPASSFDETVKRIPAVPGTITEWIFDLNCKK